MTIAAIVLNGPNSANGMQVSRGPWPAETTHLYDRLAADGLDALRAEGTALHTHQHLDIYIDGKPVAVPAGVGIDPAGRFIAPIHTHDKSGIIHVESPTLREFTLGQFFDVWGVQFNSHCIGGEYDGNGRNLTVYVDGQPYGGDPRELTLEEHQEICISLGTEAQTPNPVPAAYQFPVGL